MSEESGAVNTHPEGLAKRRVLMILLKVISQRTMMIGRLPC